MLALIDYGMGNLRSITNAINKIGYRVALVKKPEELSKHSKMILPGVGAFRDAIRQLNETGMNEAILEFSKNGKHILGICLGMQLLFDKSYEFGEHAGLGLVDGNVVAFDKAKFKESLKIPHVGWNTLHVKKNSKLLKQMETRVYLYFTHSFHVLTCENNIIGKTFYGYEFASMIEKNNIYGFQPHPEKSHENGLKILKNFMEL